MLLPIPVRLALAFALVCAVDFAPTGALAQRTFLVDCRAEAPAQTDAGVIALHSLRELNEQALGAGDRVLFVRGTVCQGSLHPRGSGFAIAATGAGPPPRIEAAPEDEAALSLFNAEHVRLESLELRGGTVYGIHISGDQPEMHGIQLRNITVSGVRGKLTKKDSGLVVIAPAGPHAHFFDVVIDGVRAFNTTQWSGIFVDGATHASIQHAVVHDVQGDGIVLFESEDGRIEDSAAWHTGMQLTQSIGTPNAIWTWRCNRCVVENNEAFLTDSPGIDGGAFDIDWGNTANTVRQNFGHDTQGYCVAVFAANGPTQHSVVESNLCLNNGRSPRLAQEQGAILICTWNGGTLSDVQIRDNRVDWHPGGDAPVVETFAESVATDVVLEGNEIRTTGTVPVSEQLPYRGAGNRYVFEGEPSAGRAGVLAREQGSTAVNAAQPDSWRFPQASATGWRLQVHLSEQDNVAGELLVRLATAMAEYAGAGLTIRADAPSAAMQRFHDADLAVDAASLPLSHDASMLELLSPQGTVAERWSKPPGAIDFGLALRRHLGEPQYGRLAFNHRE